MQLFKSKPILYSLLLFFLAVLMGMGYLGLYYQPFIADISPGITIKNKISIKTTNPDINNTLQNFVLLNSDRYEIGSNPVDVEISTEPISAKIIFNEPLIIVVNREVFLDNITTSQINNTLDGLDIENYHFSKIFIHKEDLNQQNILPSTNPGIISGESYSDILNAISGDPEALALVPLSQLNISVRPLSIDGISWQDFDNYPVSKNIYIKGHIDAINEIERYLSENYSSPDMSVILSVGDIQMGRYVGVKINRSGDPSHSFANVKDILSQPDLTFAQLETPIAQTELTSEGMILVARPETVSGLVESGIDIVSLSGNHFGDAFREGMTETFSTLDKNKIKYVGAGTNINTAWEPQFMNIGRTRIGFLTFVSIMPSSYGADEENPGTAWIDLNSNDDFNRMITSVQQASAECDILITGFHWGTEYTPNPTLAQIKFAHAAIDSGADLIVGTHPHVVQADEIYQDRYIIYSQGNFIMDQMWSEETREGVLMYVYIFDNNIISTNLVPTQIMDYSQVRVMDGGEGDYILERILSASRKL